VGLWLDVTSYKTCDLDACEVESRWGGIPLMFEICDPCTLIGWLSASIDRTLSGLLDSTLFVDVTSALGS
jgi:hypothetical protein